MGLGGAPYVKLKLRVGETSELITFGESGSEGDTTTLCGSFSIRRDSTSPSRPRTSQDSNDSLSEIPSSFNLCFSFSLFIEGSFLFNFPPIGFTSSVCLSLFPLIIRLEAPKIGKRRTEVDASEVVLRKKWADRDPEYGDVPGGWAESARACIAWCCFGGNNVRSGDSDKNLFFVNVLTRPGSGA